MACRTLGVTRTHSDFGPALQLSFFVSYATLSSRAVAGQNLAPQKQVHVFCLKYIQHKQHGTRYKSHQSQVHDLLEKYKLEARSGPDTTMGPLSLYRTNQSRRFVPEQISGEVPSASASHINPIRSDPGLGGLRNLRSAGAANGGTLQQFPHVSQAQGVPRSLKESQVLCHLGPISQVMMFTSHHERPT